MDDKGEFAARRRRSGVWGDEVDTGGVMAARSVPRPPFSTDLLAELHADNVPPEQAELLWPQVRRDPDAVRFLHSLDGVSAELRALSLDDRILHPIPTEVAARLDALLDQLSRGEQPQPVATVHQLHRDGSDGEPPATRPMPALDAIPPEPVPEEPLPPDADVPGTASPDEPISLEGHRTKRLRWFTAAAAAVAVIAGTLVAVDAATDRTVRPNALPAEHGTSVALDDELSSAAVLSAMGRNDVTGPLSGPGAMAGCVKAAVPDRTVLGSTNVTYRGESAVLILLTGPRPPKITALVVRTGCSPADPQILDMRDIG
ncbi:hypothetical protein A5789_30570 [Nocardia sp. 852002-51101_SCH5132738]|nr:hypothetical protein A5789_30570 [Nocardia sp. 852002-51101_SCH5132738]OBB37034.1 hypothetical protein A5748_03735 [Nocardia sp. 852002-51244_SCH5132740]OBF68400.1 hypothetical protein A9X06_34680 [Mycobacterium sp. 852002-51759_SCH5129042]